MTPEPADHLLQIAKRSKNAYRKISSIDTKLKNKALNSIAHNLDNNRSRILEANQQDLEKAQKSGLSEALLDRLKITPDRLSGIISGLQDVIQLEDPVGEIIKMKKRPNGLKIGQQRVPLGVIGMIYESRPNVTVDAAALCLKSGNSILLRGGSEASNTNYLLVDIMQNAIEEHIPAETIQIIRNQDHSLVNELLKLDDYVNVIIPRGGEKLIDMVNRESTMPVIKHYKGVCHVYISEHANLEMAKKVSLNAKTQRLSVCNAMETLLINENISDDFVKNLFDEFQDHNIELRVDDHLLDRLHDDKINLKKASNHDWTTEYLDSILSVRSVTNTDEAINHINQYGSNHSDSIITDNYNESQQFIDQVDSAAVYVNASTRFTDGYEFGLGAEIGISTERIHSRGPMGLKDLTIPKYIIYGQGQVRT